MGHSKRTLILCEQGAASKPVNPHLKAHI